MSQNAKNFNNIVSGVKYCDSIILSGETLDNIILVPPLVIALKT